MASPEMHRFGSRVSTRYSQTVSVAVCEFCAPAAKGVRRAPMVTSSRLRIRGDISCWMRRGQAMEDSFTGLRALKPPSEFPARPSPPSDSCYRAMRQNHLRTRSEKSLASGRAGTGANGKTRGHNRSQETGTSQDYLVRVKTLEAARDTFHTSAALQAGRFLLYTF